MATPDATRDSEALVTETTTQSSEAQITDSQAVTSEKVTTEEVTTLTEAESEAQTSEEVVFKESEYFYLVNKQNPLPEDFEIETEIVEGKYELEPTAAYWCKKMIEAAKEDGIELKIISAYRTVKYQKRLFERNVESRMEKYGWSYEKAYADTSVNIAPPGASEHNAGLAVDIVTKDDWDTYEAFDQTEEFRWLQENAADFGFILRYLKGKEEITGYIYEPWHYRYVGTEYSYAVRDSGLCLEEFFEQFVYVG